MAAPLTGQITVSGSAQQISTLNPSAYTIKASSTNGNPVFIGTSSVTTGTGFRLDAGETFDVEKRQINGLPRYETALSEWYVVGTASDVVSWVGFP